jgi:cell wall-associated NlpC family hydrolase
MSSVLEAQQRAKLVTAALTWVGTPYHHHAQVKGHGVDCATLLVCVAREAGLIGHIDLPEYSPQWHLHRSAQMYLATILKICREVPAPPWPGDVAIWQFGRCFSHGAIVIEWPRVVHACVGDKVRVDDVSKNPWLLTVGERGIGYGKPRPMKIVSLWER